MKTDTILGSKNIMLKSNTLDTLTAPSKVCNECYEYEGVSTRKGPPPFLTNTSDAVEDPPETFSLDTSSITISPALYGN